MKHQQRVRFAATKDTTKITPSIPKSKVTTAKRTTKPSLGTAQKFKSRNGNHPDPRKERIPRLQTIRKARTDAESSIKINKRSEKHR